MDLDNYKIIDITPEVNSEMAVYPGDVNFSRNVSMDTKKGDHLTLSSITTTLHLGAHADASIHYHRDGVGIEARKLNHYLGKAQVIEVNIAKNKRIVPADFSEAIIAPRVLFKTNSFIDFSSWRADYNSLSPELIEFLKEKKVITVGIDTPSIDPDDSKELPSHLSVFKHNFAVLEGLKLKSVNPGLYQLIALPLKLKDADASPVRAILLEEQC